MEENKNFILKRVLSVLMSGIFLATSYSGESMESKKINRRIQSLMISSYFTQESINELKGKYILGAEFSMIGVGYGMAVLEDKIEKAKTPEEKNEYLKEYQQLDNQVKNRMGNHDMAEEQVTIKRQELLDMQQELTFLREQLLTSTICFDEVAWDHTEELDMPRPRLMLLKPEESNSTSKIGESNFDL